MNRRTYKKDDGIELPDEFNLANYYLYDRLNEGFADKVAIRFGDFAYTYQEVADRSRALSQYFHTSGLAAEQRVYIVLPDVPPFAWSFFATLTYGAVVAMGNPYLPKEDLEQVLDYSRAAVLITVPRVAKELAPALAKNRYLKSLLLVPEAPTGEDSEADIDVDTALEKLPCEVKTLTEAIKIGKNNDVKALPPTKKDDVAIWLFTSGSTGESKAAMHTHRDFVFNTENFAKTTIGYKEDDVTISVPRLFFGYATGTNLMFPFSVGATSCLFSEKSTPESLAKAIAMYRPTIVTNVPTMMSKLLEHDEQLQKEGKPGLDFSSVRFNFSAGEALPPPLLKRFMERYDVDVYDGIGSAEMFHIYISNRPGDIKPGSLGRAVEGYELRILDTDADGPGAPELPRGETGMLWVRGESTAIGYFQDRQKSWQTFHGEWCRTGDLFRMDEEGYLWFSGRADSLFKVGGIFVAPLEIEECLMEHRAVALSAVIPAKRDDLDKPKAFVVVREGVRAELDSQEAKAALKKELQEHVRDRLSKHKYPRWVVFVDDLPKNDRGKINRKALINQERQGMNPWE